MTRFSLADGYLTTTWYHNPHDHNMELHQCGNHKSCMTCNWQFGCMMVIYKDDCSIIRLLILFILSALVLISLQKLIFIQRTFSFTSFTSVPKSKKKKKKTIHKEFYAVCTNYNGNRTRRPTLLKKLLLLKNLKNKNTFYLLLQSSQTLTSLSAVR